MIGRTNTGGGGGGKAFAVIHVDYPAGSICTCTNGTKTLKAKDTSGVWNFLVPESGNWIVASHTTGKEKSQTVAISSQGQAVNVVLAYVITIFDGSNGGDNTAVTGGWYLENTDGKAWTSVSNTAISGSRIAQANQTASAFAATKNAIDLTGVSVLKVTFTQATNTTVFVGNGSTASDADGMIGNFAASVTGSVGTVQIDVSQLNGSYQIGIGRGWASTYAQSFTVTKVWAE